MKHPKETEVTTRVIREDHLTELYKLLANQLNLYHPDPETHTIKMSEYWTVLERTLQAFGYTHYRLGVEGIESTPILLIAPEELRKELRAIQKHTVKTLIEERDPPENHEYKKGETARLPLVNHDMYVTITDTTENGTCEIQYTTPQGQQVRTTVNKNDLRPLTENPEE